MNKYFLLKNIVFFLFILSASAEEISFIKNRGESTSINSDQFKKVIHGLIRSSQQETFKSADVTGPFPFLKLTEKIYGFDILIEAKIGPIYNAHFRSGMRFGFSRNED